MCVCAMRRVHTTDDTRVGKGNAVAVKEEVPGWAEYQQQIIVARSAKGFLFLENMFFIL